MEFVCFVCLRTPGSVAGRSIRFHGREPIWSGQISVKMMGRHKTDAHHAVVKTQEALMMRRAR